MELNYEGRIKVLTGGNMFSIVARTQISMMHLNIRQKRIHIGSKVVDGWPNYMIT